MADVAILDFSKPAPGMLIAPARNRKAKPGPSTIAATWAKYKAENDPPGITTTPDLSLPGLHPRRFRFRCEWTVRVVSGGVEYAVTFNERDQPTARAAAWRWYEARVVLYNILRKLRPPREYWPVILTWSDDEWIEVHTFLVTNFDVILTGGADGLTFPQVLLG